MDELKGGSRAQGIACGPAFGASGSISKGDGVAGKVLSSEPVKGGLGVGVRTTWCGEAAVSTIGGVVPSGQVQFMKLQSAQPTSNASVKGERVEINGAVLWGA